jgi:serine/threonine-protein kinase RsbW
MSVADERLEFQIPSSEEGRKRILSLAGPLFDSWGIADNRRLQVMAALSEALANAIVHGNRGVAERSVTVQVERQGERVRIRVADQGTGFDHAAVMERLTRLERDIGRIPGRRGPGWPPIRAGLGISMMKQFVDRLTYNEKGNCVTLEVRIGGDSSSK